MAGSAPAPADRSTLAQAVARLSGCRVLCIGDIMLDRFVYGAVRRISPEGPIPILHEDRRRAMLGGAGNVAANLVALGAACKLIAVRGDDEDGAELAGMVADLARADAQIITVPGRPTTRKTRFIAAGQQILRVDREVAAPIPDAITARLIGLVEAAAPRVSAIILSDYGKGVVGPELLRAAIGAGKRHGIPVVVDPKGRDFGRYAGAAAITPNRAELAAATGRPVASDDDAAAAAGAVMQEHGFAMVLATRSDQGMTLVEGETTTHYRAEAREVFDVSGAGDTVVATFTAALAAGEPAATAAALANSAAGLVVGKLGTATVAADDLAQALSNSAMRATEAKVKTLSQALRQVAAWRADGLTIGFTNGCFDLLHPGHISLIHQARRACDRLIVGLNSDASVARLKGAGRPVQPEAARALVLGALAAVDLVIVFAEDTPLVLIDALKPDVLVKGADYRIDQVVGGDMVAAYGGRVLLAELEPGFSTTRTISRIAG